MRWPEPSLSAATGVHLADLDAEDLDAVRYQLTSPERHSRSAVDLTDADERWRLLSDAQEATGGLVALAHVAAMLMRRPGLYHVREADWD